MAEHRIEGLIGVWILLAPWILGFSDLSLAKWSSVVSGIVLIVLNAWELFGGEETAADGGDANREGAGSRVGAVPSRNKGHQH